MNGLRQDQQALRDRLSKLLDDMKKNGMMPGQRGDKGPAGQGQDGRMVAIARRRGLCHGRCRQSAGEGNADSAVGSQGRALEALRKGAQNLAQSMQQGEGQETGPGNRGRQQNSGNTTDPLAVRSMAANGATI
jgi:hypothetical protein